MKVGYPYPNPNYSIHMSRGKLNELIDKRGWQTAFSVGGWGAHCKITEEFTITISQHSFTCKSALVKYLSK